MRLFKDKDLKNEIKELDLGIVNAGETKKYSFFIHNDTLALLEDIIVETDNPEVKVEHCPRRLGARETGEVNLEWHASVSIKKGLKTALKIKGSELYS